MNNYFLKTVRLGLSIWNENDLNKALSLWGNPNVTKFITASGSMSHDEVHQRLNKEINTYKTYNVQYWPVYLLKTNEFIGCCGLRPYNLDDNIYEIGIHLKEEFWGLGFAKEICTEVIKYAFDELKVSALFAGHNPNNLKSPKLLKSLGFTYTHDEYYEPTGLNHPSYILKNTKKTIKAVLFDFDGVLTLDASGSLSIANYICSKINLTTDEFLNSYYKYNDDLLYGKTTHKEIWQSLCNDLNIHIDINILYDSFINTPLDNKMFSLVSQLKKHGYKTGMVTDNKKDRIDSLSEYYEWSNIFDAISVSASIGSGKNFEDIFLQALSSLNVQANECIFIDNQKKNLIVPQKLGMSVIYFDDLNRDYEHIINELKKLSVNL